MQSNNGGEHTVNNAHIQTTAIRMKHTYTYYMIYVADEDINTPAIGLSIDIGRHRCQNANGEF